MYEFKQEDAYRFARDRSAQAKQKGDELIFSTCPYCCGGKSNDKQTFSINLNNGKYNCFRSSCGATGNFITLARDFDFSLGNEYEDFYKQKKQYRKFATKKIESKDGAIEYLEKRGISGTVTKRYEITVQNNNPNILVFPFYNEDGELKFIKYRKMDFQKGVDKSKEWCEANCMSILFGMKQCNDKFDRLIVNEGQIDSLSLAEAGIENAVSVPTGALGMTWVSNVWSWFRRFKELIVFGDNENGKMTLIDELKKRFPGIVKAVRIEDYKGEKDANDLLRKHGKQALVDAVNNAELIPISCVKPLAEVKSVDIYSLPKIKSGIRELDRLIGGLYFGQLLLLTGKRGDGKSTFMSQLIVEALEQGYKTFIYSGELNDYYFKRWLDTQLAGKRNLHERETDGNKSWFVANSTIDRIGSWYRDKAFIFDNNIIEDDEVDDLLKTIENVVMQYGIQFVCIDNLMTAIDIGLSENLNRAQSRFVGKLAKLAKKYSIAILLVAHPRKSMNGYISNDDVSGSSDITNKVDVVMSYVRGGDMLSDERMLDVTKNRLTGRLTKKDNGIKLFYQESSKRICGIEKDFDKVYSWEETDSDGFIDAGQISLPFPD